MKKQKQGERKWRNGEEEDVEIQWKIEEAEEETEKGEEQGE